MVHDPGMICETTVATTGFIREIHWCCGKQYAGARQAAAHLNRAHGHSLADATAFVDTQRATHRARHPRSYGFDKPKGVPRPAPIEGFSPQERRWKWRPRKTPLE
jgi:hypothetical protein